VLSLFIAACSDNFPTEYGVYAKDGNYIKITSADNNKIEDAGKLPRLGKNTELLIFSKFVENSPGIERYTTLRKMDYVRNSYKRNSKTNNIYELEPIDRYRDGEEISVSLRPEKSKAMASVIPDSPLEAGVYKLSILLNMFKSDKYFFVIGNPQDDPRHHSCVDETKNSYRPCTELNDELEVFIHAALHNIADREYQQAINDIKLISLIDKEKSSDIQNHLLVQVKQELSEVFKNKKWVESRDLGLIAVKLGDESDKTQTILNLSLAEVGKIREKSKVPQKEVLKSTHYNLTDVDMYRSINGKESRVWFGDLKRVVHNGGNSFTITYNIPNSKREGRWGIKIPQKDLDFTKDIYYAWKTKYAGVSRFDAFK
jgi:hypothetical protein